MVFRVGLIATFIAATAASSWVTLQALHYLDGPRASSMRIVETGGAIIVSEASYGLNCRDFATVPPQDNRVRAGNATQAVAAACNQKSGTCQFAVDVERLGDPARECSKDFHVAWRCGPGGVAKQARLSAEAHGRTINISCPR